MLLSLLVACLGLGGLVIYRSQRALYHITAPWLDSAGQPINAHGAGVLAHDGTYYLYGERKAGKTHDTIQG